MSSMKPDASKVTIGNNKARIKEFLSDVILAPRARIMAWSRITNQTPNLKIGYPGQHLASLITGIPGTGTGARGDDIADGTEVKSCSRVDQVDTCLDCASNVFRVQTSCPKCGSSNIRRNNDSKWLITIHNRDELNLYLNEIPRTLFLISDYPNFDEGDYDTLRFTSFEIWNQSERAAAFRQILKDYLEKIYSKHTARDRDKTPAPKNFWPYSYQFYMCNPIKTFECIIRNAGTEPEIEITHYVDPRADRKDMPSENLPAKLLKDPEIAALRSHGIEIDENDSVDEEAKRFLCLRDTSRAMPHKTAYRRRKPASK